MSDEALVHGFLRFNRGSINRILIQFLTKSDEMPSFELGYQLWNLWSEYLDTLAMERSIKVANKITAVRLGHE
jgi:hypothetical protein